MEMNVKSYPHEKYIIAIKEFIRTIEKEFCISMEFQFFYVKEKYSSL